MMVIIWMCLNNGLSKADASAVLLPDRLEQGAFGRQRLRQVAEPRCDLL